MSDTVIVSAISAAGSLATTVISGLIAVRLGNLHQQLNSRMDQLLTSEKATSRAEGVVAGQESGKVQIHTTKQSSRDLPVE